MKYIVSISGGLGSAEALRRTIEKHGKENVIAVFADVKGDGYSHFFSEYPHINHLLHERFGGETRDTYRFIWQLSHHFDIPIHRVTTDKTIFTVFAEKKALRLVINGNIFFCPASEELKRQAIASWIKANVTEDFTMILGMGWDEDHRTNNAGRWWSNLFDKTIPVEAPNAKKPYADNVTIAHWLNSTGIDIPSAYQEGFEHNNCHGGCVQAGQTHWANLYNTRHNVYMYWAWMEKQLQDYIGHDYTILKDTRGGTTTRLSLYQFIDRIKAGDYRKIDGIACACFVSPVIANFLAQAEIA